MPFTGSHPAAVLPLLRGPLPASALVIGSMAPDFPYYLPISTASWPTHTALGVVGLDLALGAAGWLLWHAVVSPPALAYAPGGIRARLTQVPVGLPQRLGPRTLLLTTMALVIGSATHVGWDEFTHPGRFGPDHLPVLARRWGPMAGWHWAQYASGLFGAAAICWSLLGRWRRTQPQPTTASRYAWQVWGGLLVVSGGAGAAGASTAGSVRAAAFDGATAAGGTGAAVALLLALGWWASRATSFRDG